jgi:hypothetical protein
MFVVTGHNIPDANGNCMCSSPSDPFFTMEQATKDAQDYLEAGWPMSSIWNSNGALFPGDLDGCEIVHTLIAPGVTFEGVTY